MSFPGTSKAIYTDERGKRQVYPAVQYIDCVITQCESMSRQEEIFPTKYGKMISKLKKKKQNQESFSFGRFSNMLLSIY